MKSVACYRLQLRIKLDTRSSRSVDKHIINLKLCKALTLYEENKPRYTYSANKKKGNNQIQERQKNTANRDRDPENITP